MTQQINEVIGYNNADIDQVSAYQNMVYIWASVVSTVFLFAFAAFSTTFDTMRPSETESSLSFCITCSNVSIKRFIFMASLPSSSPFDMARRSDKSPSTVAGVDQNASSVMNELNEMQNATDDIAVYANEMKERAYGKAKRQIALSPLNAADNFIYFQGMPAQTQPRLKSRRHRIKRVRLSW